MQPAKTCRLTKSLHSPQSDIIKPPIMKKIYFIKKKFAQHGGAELYMKTLIEQLKKEYEIHILAADWSPTNGVAFHSIPQTAAGSFVSNLSFTSNIRKMINSIRKTEPDASVVSFERTDCQDIYRAGEGCHAEWLEIRSKTEPFFKRLSFRLNPLHLHMLNMEQRLFRTTPVIIANSKMVKDQIIKHYAVPAERIQVLYNGVDLKKFSPGNKDLWRAVVRKQCELTTDAKVAFFVGSGFKRKGLKMAIDAIAEAAKQKGDSHLRLLVIGKGNSQEYLSQAKKLGIAPLITFLETQRGIEKFYAAADIFVLPTLYDPFSNATLEAMASGLPVVTTKNNGAAELIDSGKEGFVLEDLFDTRELAFKMLLAFENQSYMGMKARERAETCSIESAANKFAEVISIHEEKF